MSADGDEKKDSPSTATAAAEGGSNCPRLPPDENGATGRMPAVFSSHQKHNVVATPRSNVPPPQMAFFRLESSSQPPSRTNSDDGSVTPLRDSSQPQFVASRDDNNNELTASLLPISSSQHSTSQSTTAAPSSSHNLLRCMRHPIHYIQQHYWTSENRLKFRRFIRKFGDYLASLSLLTMLVVVPIVLYRALSNRQLDRAAYHSARVMVMGTIVLSVRLVYLHLTHWYMPDVQKYIVRILWMVPIYSMQSYLSLRYHHARIYMSTVRDFYESYVIASFVYYLMELLGGQEALTELLRQKDPSLGHHSFPFNLLLEPWRLGTEFLLQCKHGVLQYVVFKTIATVVTFLCEFAGVYGEGRFSWFYAYPYLCFFQNVSVMYALYCLVIFFHAVNDELRHPVDWHPLGKFLCIKGVVFFTWWQGVVIFYLRDHGIIDKMGSWSSYDVANGLIDYCIVLEMVGFAIAHSYTFTYKEYLPGGLVQSATDEAAAGTAASTAEENADSEIPEPLSAIDGAPVSRQNSTYRPPATLHRPMKFKDAFWSSTVPKETLEDIQRLRSGIMDRSSLMTMNHTPERRRSFSLTEINMDELNNDGEPSVANDPLIPPSSEDGLARAQTMHF